MKTNLEVLSMAVLCAWASGDVYAGPVGPLTTFAAGTPAKASEVNGNFSAVSTAVDDNDARITLLETTVSSGHPRSRNRVAAKWPHPRSDAASMVSERGRRQLDRPLDDAETALHTGEWTLVAREARVLKST